MSRTRAEWVLPTSMLIGTFAWSFVYVSLPFHIQRIWFPSSRGSTADRGSGTTRVEA